MGRENGSLEDMFDGTTQEGCESCLEIISLGKEMSAITKKPNTRGDKHVTAKDKVFAGPYFQGDKRDTGLQHFLHFEMVKKKEPNCLNTHLRNVKFMA